MPIEPTSNVTIFSVVINFLDDGIIGGVFLCQRKTVTDLRMKMELVEGNCNRERKILKFTVTHMDCWSRRIHLCHIIG